MKSLCCHINANLTFCKRRCGYNLTNMCKLHFHDINGDRKESKVQDKRLDQLRKRLKDTGFWFQ